MALTINTNVASLNAQKNLAKSGGALSIALSRLSSGLRINSARDDAAGMAIASRFTSQIKGLTQAMRNGNDGISMAQTAEGALQEYSNLLQRVRELSVQSANATNSASDRASLQFEVAQLKAEMDRIATDTTFNGQKVLDGTLSTAAFQVGADANQTISVSFSSARTTAIGGYAEAASSVNTNAIQAAILGGAALSTTGDGSTTANYKGVDATVLAASDFTINGTANVAAVAGTNGRGADSAYAKAIAINASGMSGVTASATSVVYTSVGTDGFNISQGTNGDAEFTFSLNGVSIYTSVTADKTVDTIITDVNAVTSQTGIVASKTSGGNLVFTASDGRNIEMTAGFTEDTGAAKGTLDQFMHATQAVATAASATATIRGQVTLSSQNNIIIAGTTPGRIGFTGTTLQNNANGTISSMDISTVVGANNAIKNIDAALTSINSIRAGLGAAQNRFESTIKSLATTVENLSAARGRVLDADFASETAALMKANILQQAGVSILAQANALPQAVLSLLQ